MGKSNNNCYSKKDKKKEDKKEGHFGPLWQL